MNSALMGLMQAVSMTRGGNNRPLPYTRPTSMLKVFAVRWRLQVKNASQNGELKQEKLSTQTSHLSVPMAHHLEIQESDLWTDGETC